MTVQKKYTKSPEGSIATYDFFDISEGSGTVAFYGYAVDTGTGTKAYKFTTNSGLNSASGTNNLIFGKTTFSKAGGANGEEEVNFDLLFNLPKNMKGNVYFNIQNEIMLTNPGSTLALKIRLLKVDSSAVETAISSQITTETLTAVAGSTSPFFAVQVPLTALTHFKKGETFRAEIIIVYDLSASSTTFSLYHSPTSQLSDTAIVTQKLICFIPFVIDI